MEDDGSTTGPRVYFDVDDINAGTARVRELGGEDGMPVPGMGWFATCKDDQGNDFGLGNRPVGVGAGVVGRQSGSAGSVTTRRSPSSATSPPSARTTWTTAAPRIPGLLAEDDRRLRRDRLERDARAVDGDGDLDTAVPRRGALQGGEGPLDRFRVDAPSRRFRPLRGKRKRVRLRTTGL